MTKAKVTLGNFESLKDNFSWISSPLVIFIRLCHRWLEIGTKLKF